MGATTEDTQREIAGLRSDMTAAVSELERRLRGGVSGVMSADARVSTVRTSMAAVETVREKPSVAAVAGTVAVAAVGYGVYSLVNRWRESRTPQHKLKSKVEDVREGVEGRVAEARRLLEETRKRGVLLKVEREGDDYLRVLDARLDTPKTGKGKRTNVLKNLLWAAMLSLFMAFAGVAARRAAGAIWRATIREDPPTEKK